MEAFAFCFSLESINIPASLLHIHHLCFDGDEQLSEVTFESPSQLTSIGDQVFQDCRMLSFLYIPPRLEIMDGITFYRSCIHEVEVDPANPRFLVIDSCLINLVAHSIVHSFSDESSVVVSNSIEELGLHAFAEEVCLTAVTFESPSICSKFLDGAFLSCSSLESICIPASVQSLGYDCFTFCRSLASVTFEQPSLLVIIDDGVFNSCESLTQISIPASIQRIGSQCFVACDSLHSITFESPSNLTMLCDLGDLIVSSLEIPDSVEVINGMTTSSAEGSLVVSFGPESKLSFVYPRPYQKQGIGAFVRYSEATLRKFRSNIDDFAYPPAV
jgi:hypothetical protein